MDSKRYFDNVAPEWDTMRQSFFSESLREKAISLAEVQPGKVAADIGAGTGFVTQGLLNKDLRVIAVDQSESMLTEIGRKFANTDRVDCRLGEAETLPIPDQSVDYVFANMYLHHVESPKTAIMEMARILKPGGRLVITDLDEHNFDFLKTEQHDRWMGFKRDDVQHWLKGTGLKDVEVVCANEDCSSKSTGRNEHSASPWVAATILLQKGTYSNQGRCTCEKPLST